MPKEYIITDTENRRAEEHGGRREAIRIGWDRIGYVQLATVLKSETEGSTGPIEGDVDQGQFVDLDRKASNQLIRAIRKARDEAFGKDA